MIAITTRTSSRVKPSGPRGVPRVRSPVDDILVLSAAALLIVGSVTEDVELPVLAGRGIAIRMSPGIVQSRLVREIWSIPCRRPGWHLDEGGEPFLCIGI